MADPKTYVEWIWRQEVDAAIETLHLAEAEADERNLILRCMWAQARNCTIRHLRALERIGAAANHLPYPPLVACLRRLQQERTAA